MTAAREPGTIADVGVREWEWGLRWGRKARVGVGSRLYMIGSHRSDRLLTIDLNQVSQSTPSYTLSKPRSAKRRNIATMVKSEEDVVKDFNGGLWAVVGSAPGDPGGVGSIESACGRCCLLAGDWEERETEIDRNRC